MTRTQALSRISRSLIKTSLAVGLALSAFALPACSEDVDSDGGGGAGGAAIDPRYALSSMVWDTEGNTTTYVNLLADIDVESINHEKAREFAGAADIWFHDGSLYVAEGVALTITRYTIEDGELIEHEKIGFTDFGVTDFGFWRNVFVAPDKAYFLSGTNEYVIWNPREMSIEGTFEVPELPARDGLEPFPGYSDRAAVVRGNRLYQPVYYTDPNESFFVMDPGSSLLVVDIENDEVVDVLDLPCPGMDFASQDDDGNLVFSSWVFAPGGAAVVDQSATCVVQLPVDSDEPKVLFDVADVTDGRQGGMFRYLGDGKAFLSVLHSERSDSESPSEVADGPNWKFWLYDIESGTAEESDAFDFNAGAAYDVSVDGKKQLLVPAGDYASTKLYEVSADGTSKPQFTSPGWSLRLFELP